MDLDKFQTSCWTGRLPHTICQFSLPVPSLFDSPTPIPLATSTSSGQHLINLD
jgi:hypothetical protein